MSFYQNKIFLFFCSSKISTMVRPTNPADIVAASQSSCCSNKDSFESNTILQHVSQPQESNFIASGRSNAVPHNNVGETRPQTSRKRAVLTASQASEIFFLRPLITQYPDRVGANERLSCSSTDIARRFKISPKAVRDVWNR